MSPLDRTRLRLETAQSQLDAFQRAIRMSRPKTLPTSVRAHLQRLEARVARRAAEHRLELARERAKTEAVR